MISSEAEDVHTCDSKILILGLYLKEILTHYSIIILNIQSNITKELINKLFCISVLLNTLYWGRSINLSYIY